jgi:hypothetical protein
MLAVVTVSIEQGTNCVELNSQPYVNPGESNMYDAYFDSHVRSKNHHKRSSGRE